MDTVLEFVKKINADKKSSPIFLDIEKYLLTGDKKTLKKITTSGAWQYYSDMYKYASKLQQFLVLSDNNNDEMNSRLLDVLIKTNRHIDILEKYLKNEKADEKIFPVFVESCRRAEIDESELAGHVFYDKLFYNSEKKLNSAAHYYLSMSDQQLIEILNPKTDILSEFAIEYFTEFLLEYATKRIESLLTWLVLYKPSRLHSSKNKKEEFCTDAAVAILNKTGKQHAKAILETWEQLENVEQKIEAGRALAKTCPEVFRQPVRKVVLDALKKNKNQLDETIACFLVENFELEFVDIICEFLKTAHSSSSYYACQWISCICEAAVATLGDKAMPYLDAALKNAEPNAHLRALRLMVDLKNDQFDEKIAAQFAKEFASGKDTLNFLQLAKKWKPELLVEPLWGLLGNKSRPTREMASRMLGDLGKVDLERVKKLLTEKKADFRESAVNILAKIGDDASIKLLESRVDEETDDDVRDKILLALESAWEARGEKITMKKILHRVERAADRIAKFECKWLDVKKLPPLVAEQKKLDEQTVRYLLYRQSRCKEMCPDIEAKPLLAMIDRKSSGDFALAVLNAFLASKKQEAADRWAIALAGLLGDDRVVPILSKQIQTWADNARGKMSEYAVQALALLGTETALTIVNSMMIRYRTKYKNIGTAAETAFANAAEQRGMTPDELGDCVVPWLDFEPDKTKVWNIGGKDFEVRIDMNFKVSLFDTEKKKNVASLPKTASKEITDELKEMKDALKEVLKGQLLRIENMLVRQYRWPLDRWQTLYLKHPILRPFTVRLVWGEYDPKGKLLQTFRALEDGTLTDASDDTVKLAKTSRIGIVHPLELNDKQRGEWQQHLIDYDIAAPFPQMERSVIVPKEEERALTSTGKWNGTDLNAMTFKGRAEKLGWRRGSVCDAGSIISYWKTFPESGADVFLSLEGMFIGVSVDDSVTLGDLCFVKTGMTRVGSYTYDEPVSSSDEDTRLIAFGDVPPIVFSEVFGDMKKIAGEKDE